MSQVITKTKNLNAIGPYSLAVEKGGLLFLSGQIGIDQEKNIVPGGAVEEFKVIMKNIKEVLAEAGYNLNDVIKVTLYLSDMGVYKQINEIYSQYFEEPYPVRSTIEVARLPLDASIEVEVTAGR